MCEYNQARNKDIKTTRKNNHNNKTKSITNTTTSIQPRYPGEAMKNNVNTCT